MKPFFAVFAATLSLGTIAFTADSHESLYTRLGGEKAVHAMVDEWDQSRGGRRRRPQMVPGHFAKDAHAEAAFEKNVADYFCKATGGTCAYHGPGSGRRGSAPDAGSVDGHREAHGGDVWTGMKVHEAEKHERSR